MNSSRKDRFPLSLKQCRIIQAVAKGRSESAAADLLNLTQSNVSRTLISAEQSLGHKLFTRGWGGANPTNEGEVLISQCNAILKDITRAEAELAKSSSSPPLLQPYLEWRHLEVVDALATLGSASAAAEKLGQSQPAVSRTLKAVENMVRQPLFTRRRLGMEPLQTARILVSLGMNILPRAIAISKILATMPTGLTGRLSVGMLPFSSQEIVPHAFGKLSNEYPHLRLQAMQAPYPMLVSALQHREIDCFLGLIRHLPSSSDLMEVPLLEARYKIVAHKDHPAHDSAKTLADLISYNWIVAPHGTPIRSYFEALFEQIGEIPPVQTTEMLTLDSAEQMLMYSNAVGLQVYDVKRADDVNPNLKELNITLPAPQCIVGVTHLKNNQDPAFDKFLYILKDIVRQRLSPV